MISPLKFLNNRIKISFFTSPSVPIKVGDFTNLLKPRKLLKILSLHLCIPLYQIINDSFQSEALQKNQNCYSYPFVQNVFLNHFQMVDLFHSREFQ